jgi:hypothetical protein
LVIISLLLQIGLGLLLLHSRDQGQTSDLDAALAAGEAGVAGVPPPPPLAAGVAGVTPPPLREQALAASS